VSSVASSASSTGAPPGRAVVASSLLGGVTARHVPAAAPPPVRAGSVNHESPTKTGGAYGLGVAGGEREKRKREREQRERERDGSSAALPRRAVVASSLLGSVTARHDPGTGHAPPPARAGSVNLKSPTKTGGAYGLGGARAEREKRGEAREREREQRERERDGPSATLLDKVRALDALPRVGALQTLDLRGNDLGVRF
jgi:hypothetical protein